MMLFDVDKYNADVKGWGQNSLQVLRVSLAALNVRERGRLLAELKVRYSKRYGQVRSIGYQFPRYGVFVEKGAGRGYGGKKGSQWRTNGARRRTDPASLGKMGTGRRQAKPWFNPIMDARVGALADLVVKHMGTAAVNNIRIR